MKNQSQFKLALGFFGDRERRLLESCGRQTDGAVFEIRFYADKAVALQTDGGLFFCRADGGLSDAPGPGLWAPDGETLLQILSRAAAFSLFLYEEELRQGFLTKNGCRIGVCGVSSAGKVLASGISSLHIRIPYTVDHTRWPLLERVLLSDGGVLVAGPPGCGKTTLLKRCVWFLCSGALGRFCSVAVIDSRGEFSDALRADPTVLTADLLPAADKASGMETAVRLLSPEVVICDEIGSPAEARQLRGAAFAGVRVFASVHAANAGELSQKKHIAALLRAGVFRQVLFLSGTRRGEILRRLEWREACDEICGGAAAVAAAGGAGSAAGGSPPA